MAACLNAKLTGNQQYPAYQLHGCMANKKTPPKEGLKLAALIALDWLKNRLGEDIPEELSALPALENYRETEEEQLHSFTLDMGFTVEVAALWSHGIWAMRVVEPDLGGESEPGQPRQAVPGRVLDTGIAFRINGAQLECGFKTVVSEPVGTQERAEVCCPEVVERLMNHPDFGLREQAVLSTAVKRLDSREQLNTMLELWQNRNNPLPCVVFTQTRIAEEKVELPSMEELLGSSPLPGGIFPLKLNDTDKLPEKPKASDPPYEIENLARSGGGFFHTFLLKDSLLAPFAKAVKGTAEPGDVFVLEPAPFGGKVHRHPFKPSRSRQQELMDRLDRELHNYLRERELNFGGVVFVQGTKKLLMEHNARTVQNAQENSARWEEKLTQLNEDWKEKLSAQAEEMARLREQLNRQQEYGDRLEREKEELRRSHQEQLAQMKNRMEEAEEKAAYLKRKLNQPKEHDKVAAWVSRYFQGRLILHPKAVDLLTERSARDINIETICDALDFLATDYWERRYHQLPNEEMNTRCAEKYGRPFDVRPTGTTTIEFTPSQYKVKYFPGRRGKPVESPLDFHLSVGNDPQNLLRIYFLHDDEKQLIVVGSLPRHLRAVTIK